MSTTHPKLMTFLITILMPWTNLKNENDLNDDFQNGLAKTNFEEEKLGNKNDGWQSKKKGGSMCQVKCLSPVRGNV